MEVIELHDIVAAIDREAVIAALEDGFRRYSAGKVQLSPVGYLDLGGGGDCHIKAALAEGQEFFAAKFVNGVPANRGRGLPVQDGVVLLSNASTGAIEAILHDRGELTEMRTALAGVAAVRLIARPAPGRPASSARAARRGGRRRRSPTRSGSTGAIC